MKKLFFTFLIVAGLASCGPTANDAVGYNEKITNLVDTLNTFHYLFIDQLDAHNVDSLNITYNLFEERAALSLNRIKGMGPFAGKKEFRTAATEYFATLDHIVKHEGKGLVAILSKDSSLYTLEDLESITKLSHKFDENYEKAFTRLEAAQALFARQWGFTIEANKAAPKK